MNLTPTGKTSKRKKEIIRLAAHLYKEKGFVASTMRNLATEIGLEAASLYNHIRSKEEILAVICFGMANKYDELMQHVGALDISPVEKIKKIITYHIDLAIEYPNEMIVMQADWKHLTPTDRQRYKALISKYESQIIKILRAGMEQGHIALANPRIIMYTLLSSLNWLGRWYNPEREISKEEINKTIQDLIIMGISQ